ncbi:hypothetical protein LBMAG53_05790 [Planctomycetota bacterium]|nr:hypothetical protein LBMAG53_05790 [Planctomycetota bacterium]
MISRLRRAALAVRRSPTGEGRAGRGGRGWRPRTRDRLLGEADQAAEAAVFSLGHSLVGEGYDFDGARRGEEPWVLLQYTLSGEGRLRRGGRELACAPGTLLVLPVPDRHRYWLPAGGRWEFCYASMRGSAPRRAVARLLAATGPVVALEEREPAVAALAELVLAGLADPPPSPYALSAAAFSLAMHLLQVADRLAVSGPDLPEPFADLPDWCRSRLARRGRLSVAELAVRHGTSREHFSRRFTTLCGRSPGRFLAELRHRAALAALHRGTSAAAAARESGLATVSGLRRRLRREIGYPW